jgi:hypothetical protein
MGRFPGETSCLSLVWAVLVSSQNGMGLRDNPAFARDAEPTAISNSSDPASTDKSGGKRQENAICDCARPGGRKDQGCI